MKCLKANCEGELDLEGVEFGGISECKVCGAEHDVDFDTAFGLSASLITGKENTMVSLGYTE